MPEKSARKVQFGSDAPKTSNISLWLALGIGLLAFIANYSYLQGGSIQALKVKPGETILAGKLVRCDQFDDVEVSGRLEEMKRLLVTQSDCDAFSRIPLADTLRPGELLMQSSFSTVGGRKLSDLIPPNYHAIALPISKESEQIARDTKVGNLIDVYDCMGLQKPAPTQLASPDIPLGNRFLHGVKVVAVGAAFDVPSENSEVNSLTVLIPDDLIDATLPRVQVGVCILLMPTGGG